MMPFIREPIKNQKFELGRTINLMRCAECEHKSECERKSFFLSCGNYCRKMKTKKYKRPEDFWKVWKENNPKIVENVFECIKNEVDNPLMELFADVVDYGATFPKSVYWRPRRYYHNGVEFVRMATRAERKFTRDDWVAYGDVYYEDGKTRIGYAPYSSVPEIPERVYKLIDKVCDYMYALLELWRKEKEGVNK